MFPYYLDAIKCTMSEGVNLYQDRKKQVNYVQWFVYVLYKLSSKDFKSLFSFVRIGEKDPHIRTALNCVPLYNIVTMMYLTVDEWSKRLMK